MKIAKKTLSILLILCMALCFAPASFAASGSGTVGNITWAVDGSGTLTVSGSGAIPDYNKYGEASPNINDRPWVQYRNSIKRLVVESGITRVGSRAFQGFDKLESVEPQELVDNISAKITIKKA